MMLQLAMFENYRCLYMMVLNDHLSFLGGYKMKHRLSMIGGA